MKTSILKHSRTINLENTFSRTPINPLDELFNLKNTPYIKFIHHKDKDKYYFVVTFLSNKNCKINEVNETISNGKLNIDIKVDTSNADLSSDVIIQSLFDIDQLETITYAMISDAVKNKLDFNYIFTISYGTLLNKGNEFIISGTNSVGGNTNPSDPYPPAK
ncbi:hypothetical protein PG911_06780 [Tenacibaculum ovolyticum]|uniref:hypothetical protein n=1 Tax=Tenacibaculum ovolyticum TaxID=104270 RepID=UPI0022F3CDE6|nr:hypothetical protein [Tenacibaculum ovolyticum]WBX77955.1 hypothetical protein PG911_06780 [Tenacibaculum ovolyticum]